MSRVIQVSLLRQYCRANPQSWKYLASKAGTYKTALILNQPAQDLQVAKFSSDVKAAFRNFGEIKKAPGPVLGYGLAGLLPFVSTPAFMIQLGVFVPELAYSNLAYGAIILSFLGGTRWGATLPCPQTNDLKPDWKTLGEAVLPSLIGWTSLLVSHTPGSILVISGLLLALTQDLNTKSHADWYKSVRILLSSVAVIALLVTLVCRFVLPLEKKEQVNTTSN